MTITYQKRTPLDLAHDDVARINRDIEALEQQIASLRQEIERVKGFIALYPKYAVPLPMSQADQAEPVRAVIGGTGRFIALKMPLNIRIRNFMANKMADLVKPIPMATICEMLESNSLMPGGKEPKQAVSAILGKDQRFQYTQGEGWSLVQRPTFIGPEKEAQ